MIATESFWDYVSRVAGADQQNRDIAAHVGVDPSAVSRWKKGEPPRLSSVIASARAYKRPAVEALIAAGYLDLSDAYATVDIEQVDASRLSEISDDELTAEIQRRLLHRRTNPPTPDL
jgi:transcriptional regulator with XRE-family HTH domain